MNVIGGDFSSSMANVFDDRLCIYAPSGERTYRAGFVKQVDLVTNENKTSVLGAIGGGVAGALVAGPIGAIVGGVLNGRSSERITVVVVEDAKGHKRFVCKVSQDELVKLLALAHSPKPRHKKRDWAFLDSTPETLQCPHCAGEFLNDRSLAGAIVVCPACGQEVQMP